MMYVLSIVINCPLLYCVDLVTQATSSCASVRRPYLPHRLHQQRVSVLKKDPSLNKRDQRALGRSPEEEVKGNGGANYREPQGHNLNKFGRGPFDDVLY